MWQTGTSTDYLDLLTKLVQVATGNSASSAAVSAGGTGYVVGDTLTSVGGTFSFAATFEVLTLSGSAVATVRVKTGGAYTVNPSNPVSTTGGTGSGCTLNLTMGATGWTAVRNTTPGGEKEVILQGVGSGSDSIFVGIKTFQVLGQNGLDTARNWVLTGMTGFNSGLAFESQPGITPNAVPAATGGAYMPLKPSDGFPMSFWFSINGRRIIVVVKIENGSVTHYASCYLGWLNQFGTTTEFPYPLYICGSTNRHNALFNTTNPTITGLTEMVATNVGHGPGYWRTPDSVWQSVRNSSAVDTGSPTRVSDRNFIVYPVGQTQFAGVAVEDQNTTDGNGDWDEVIALTGIPGTNTLRIQPTPNTGGALHWLVPATVMSSSTPNFDIYGELDNVYWISAAGGVVSLDTITISGQPYRVFQNGNRTTEFSYMVIKEN